MLTTPQRQTLTLAANQDYPGIPIAGRYLEIVSCTQSTIGVGFDSDQPQVMEPGKCYKGPEGGFRSLRFLDTSGAGCTVVYRVSESQVIGLEPAGLAGILLQLQAINLEADNLVLIKNLITAGNAILTTMDADTGNIAAAEATPTDGEAGQIALAASGDGAPSNVASKGLMFWTAGTQVYLRVNTGLGAAANTHFLLKADQTYTIRIDNAQKARFHNQDAGAGATVYWQHLV